MTTLQDCVKILNQGKDGPTSIFDDKTLVMYTTMIADVGRDILKGQDEDSLLAAISIVQSGAITSSFLDGNLSANDLKFLTSEKFGEIATMMFRLAVGLAAVEELR
jgi:hypothetical protein